MALKLGELYFIIQKFTQWSSSRSWYHSGSLCTFVNLIWGTLLWEANRKTLEANKMTPYQGYPWSQFPTLFGSLTHYTHHFCPQYTYTTDTHLASLSTPPNTCSGRCASTSCWGCSKWSSCCTLLQGLVLGLSMESTATNFGLLTSSWVGFQVAVYLAPFEYQVKAASIKARYFT